MPKRNKHEITLSSSPNGAPSKRKNESSFACDDSNTLISALTKSFGGVSFNSKMKNMKVDEKYGPPRELEFYTNAKPSPNKHMSSFMSSNQSKGTGASSKFYNERFTAPPSSACNNNSRNVKVTHNIKPIQHVLKNQCT